MFLPRKGNLPVIVSLSEEHGAHFALRSVGISPMLLTSSQCPDTYLRIIGIQTQGLFPRARLCLAMHELWPTSLQDGFSTPLVVGLYISDWGKYDVPLGKLFARTLGEIEHWLWMKQPTPAPWLPKKFDPEAQFTPEQLRRYRAWHDSALEAAAAWKAQAR